MNNTHLESDSLAGQPLRSRRRKGLVTCYSAACVRR